MSCDAESIECFVVSLEGIGDQELRFEVSGPRIPLFVAGLSSLSNYLEGIELSRSLLSRERPLEVVIGVSGGSSF